MQKVLKVPYLAGGARIRRSPPVCFQKPGFTVRDRKDILRGNLCGCGNNNNVRTVGYPGCGPRDGRKVHIVDQEWCSDGAHSALIGWQNGDTTLRNMPCYTGFYRGLPVVYPIVIHSRTGRSGQQCAEFSSILHIFESRRGDLYPHPGESPKGEPRASSTLLCRHPSLAVVLTRRREGTMVYPGWWVGSMPGRVYTHHGREGA